MACRWLSAAVLLAGCRFEAASVGAGDALPPTADGGAADAVGRDAGPPGGDSADDAAPRDGPDAAPLGPFGPPTLIAPLADLANDDDPTLTADLLELYWDSARGGDDDIWVSRRASPADPWGPPALVAELSLLGVQDSDPEVAPDGLTLYYSSARPGGLGGVDLYLATRSTRADPWSAPAWIAELSSVAQEFPSNPTPDGLVILVQSTRLGSSDLFESRRAGIADPWGTPIPIVELNTAGQERTPHLMDGGLGLWFASDRPPSLGGADLFTTARASLAGPFAAPAHVSELASAADDADPTLSPDGRYIVFMSARSGNAELWEASR